MKAGYIDRSGKFYRCKYYNHIGLLYQLFNMDERDAENEGWIKVGETKYDDDDEKYYLHITKRPTVEQVKTVKRLEHLKDLYLRFEDEVKLS